MVDILPMIRSGVEGWVVKKTSSTSPQRLTDEDINYIAQASIDTLAQRALGRHTDKWGPLETLTNGWLVQKKKGTVPGNLEEEDFQELVHLVLESMVYSPVTSTEQDAVRVQPRQDTDIASYSYIGEEDTLPDGRKILDVLKEDPLYFAREHLARSL